MGTLETRAPLSFSGAWTSHSRDLALWGQGSASQQHYIILSSPTLMRGSRSIVGLPLRLALELGSIVLLLKSLAHGLSVITVPIVLNFDASTTPFPS